jgi:hypothetical protein
LAGAGNFRDIVDKVGAVARRILVDLIGMVDPEQTTEHLHLAGKSAHLD